MTSWLRQIHLFNLLAALILWFSPLKLSTLTCCLRMASEFRLITPLSGEELPETHRIY
jgi:hypothetical protein